MDRSKFFSSVRGSLFGGRLTEPQVQGMDAMLDAVPAGMSADHLAYCLATAFHETGAKMQPVVENLNYRSASRIREVWPTRFPTTAAAQMYVGKPEALANKVYGTRMGNLGGNDGWIYRGRGFVQITGRDNYKRAGRELGVDLLTFPELAEECETAAATLYCGMLQGWFTGKKLADYFKPGLVDPYNARRIINGLDRATEIAGYFRAFSAALKAAGYAPEIPAAKPVIPVIDAAPPPPDVEPAEPKPAGGLVAALAALLKSLFRSNA